MSAFLSVFTQCVFTRPNNNTSTAENELDEMYFYLFYCLISRKYVKACKTYFNRSVAYPKNVAEGSVCREF